MRRCFSGHPIVRAKGGNRCALAQDQQQRLQLCGRLLPSFQLTTGNPQAFE